MLFVRGEDDPQIPDKVRTGMRPYVVQAILAGMNYCRDGVFCDEKGTRLSERSADGEKVTGRWRRGDDESPDRQLLLGNWGPFGRQSMDRENSDQMAGSCPASARKPARTGV